MYYKQSDKLRNVLINSVVFVFEYEFWLCIFREDLNQKDILVANNLDSILNKSAKINCEKLFK